MGKKNFKAENNPAMQFISQETIDQVNAANEGPAAADQEQEAVQLRPDPIGLDLPDTKPPQGYKTNPAYIESKTRRVQILMQPSAHKELKRIADKRGTSVNDIINIAIKDFIRKERERS